MTQKDIARQIGDAKASLEREREELAASIRADIAAFRKKAVESA